MEEIREEDVDWQLMLHINDRDKGLKRLCVGGVLFFVGLLIAVAGVLFGLRETSNPSALFKAAEEDQYVYTRIQYLTESFAYYEDMDGMQFYLAFDSTFHPSVICLHTDDKEIFQPYIDSFYSDDYDNVPPEYTVVGYAKPFDEELKKFAMETLSFYYNEELAVEQFGHYFDDYYVQIGGSSSAFPFFKAAAGFMAVGVIVLGMGVLYYSAWRKFLKEITHPEKLPSPIVQAKPSRLLALLGALAGAMVGGVLWTIVGAMGFYAFWTGFLIVFFSWQGYVILRNEQELFGVVISAVCSLFIALPATYLEWVWLYYTGSNGGIYGYVPLSRVLRELPVYLKASGVPGMLMFDLILGYIFIGAGIVVSVTVYWENHPKRVKARKKREKSYHIADKAKYVNMIEEENEKQDEL